MEAPVLDSARSFQPMVPAGGAMVAMLTRLVVLWCFSGAGPAIATGAVPSGAPAAPDAAPNGPG